MVLISIGVVLVVIAITAGVAFQVDKTNKMNKTLAQHEQIQEIIVAQEIKNASAYANAKNLIKEGNLSEAEKSFQDLKGYKDADIILQYVRALEESKQKSPNYELIAVYFDPVPTNYKGDLSKEINEFQIQLKIKQDALLKQKENSIVELIQNGNYNQAETLSVLEFPVLYDYACALENEKNGDHSMALASWKDIPLDYSGPLASEILKSVNAYSKDIKEFNESIARVKVQESKPQPKIGMTASEVENSQWGKPKIVNRTTTAYGVSEQWVYSSGKYVYLDNGIVDAIQD